MDPHRYQQVKTILAEALERPPHERAALVEALCGADADLRAEVESLLAYEAGDSFLVPGAAWAELVADSSPAVDPRATPVRGANPPRPARPTRGSSSPPTVRVLDERIAGPQLWLVQAPGALLGKTYNLPRVTVTVGRAMDCDVRIDLPSISRHHAELSPIEGSGWRLRDMGSRHGVSVNGRAVREGAVAFGDHIGFGKDVVAALLLVDASRFPRDG